MILPVLPVSENQFVGGYTRTEPYFLRVLYAPRLVELRESSRTGRVLQAARSGLSIALRDRGFDVIPPERADPVLRSFLVVGRDENHTNLDELARALDADLFLFAWTDQYEQKRGLQGIQRAHFSLAVHLVDARSGERIWIHEERRTSGYEVGERFADYVEFVGAAAERIVSGVPELHAAEGQPDGSHEAH